MSMDTELCITDKTCHICYKTYAGKSQLYRHLREVHNEYEKPNSFYEKDEYIYKCLEGCDVSFRFNRDLRHHLNDCHNFNILETAKQFSSLEEFHKWLIQEQESGVNFVKHRGPKHKNKIVTYYSCNRTGFSKTKITDRRRQLKKNGTRKINAGCTSYLKLEENDDHNVVVTYCDFHYGHRIELDHLPLPPESRAVIVDKLANGAKLIKINLEKESIEFDTIQRSDLLTPYDIKGLKNFSRSQKGKLALSNITKKNSDGRLLAMAKRKNMQAANDERIEGIKQEEDTGNDRIEEQTKQCSDDEEPSDTEEHYFGYYVAEMLKQIDRNKRISARTQVNEVLQSFLTK